MRSSISFLRTNAATLLAAASFLLVLIRALRTVDPYWDTLAYHWPFAARIAGLCDFDCFTMPPSYEQRYEGFPMLWHALQGLLWRATGTPGIADVLGIGMLACLCLYLYRRYAVPLAWSWLAFLAIPEVQIQLTATYVDLPLNAALTLALLVVFRQLVEPSASQRVDIAIALVALGLGANGKLQLVPVAVGIWLVIALLAARAAIGRPLRRIAVFIALALTGALTLLPKLVLNAQAFGNPFHPIAIAVGPIRLPGVETMLQTTSISDALLAYPGPFRWLLSVLEFDAFRARPLPWTVGQGDVPQASPSFRMGGYFVAYVLALLALLLWIARSLPRGRLALIFVIALSLVCALLPLSHELRYFMFWMLALVSIVLVGAHSPLFANPDQRTLRSVAHGTITIAATSVILMTGAEYLKTSGTTLRNLVARTDAVVAGIPDGGTLCVLNRHRDAILYSTLFHPSRHYRTRVLFADEAADCTIRLDPSR